MIFELPICDILRVLNLKRVAHKGQWNNFGDHWRVNETGLTDYLILNMHHLFDLKLVKNVLQVMGDKKRHRLLDYLNNNSFDFFIYVVIKACLEISFSKKLYI